MKRGILLGLLACCVAIGSVSAADKETGITGKWATDAVATAVKATKSGGLGASLLNNAVNQGSRAVPAGGGNGGFGGGGRQGGGGFGGNNFAQFQGGGGGGQFGGAGGGGGQFGGGGGGGQFGGGGGQFGGGNRNGINVDIGPAKVLDKGASPDGAALTMVLKADKTKLSGKVKEIVMDVESTIEEAKLISPTKFEFKVYKKVSTVKVPTLYKGELVDENTITLQRFNQSGKNIDEKPDGTPDTLVFHRGK